MKEIELSNEQPPRPITIEYQETLANGEDPLVIAARLTAMQLMMWRGRFSDALQSEPIEVCYDTGDNSSFAVSSPVSGCVTLERTDQDTITRYVFDNNADTPLTAERQAGSEPPIAVDAPPAVLYNDALRMLFDANHHEQTGRT